MLDTAASVLARRLRPHSGAGDAATVVLLLLFGHAPGGCVQPQSSSPCNMRSRPECYAKLGLLLRASGWWNEARANELITAARIRLVEGIES